MNRKKIASLILATSIVTTQVATPVFASTNDNTTNVTSSEKVSDGDNTKDGSSQVSNNKSEKKDSDQKANAEESAKDDSVTESEKSNDGDIISNNKSSKQENNTELKASKISETKTSEVSVSTYQELENAMKNKSINVINVSNDISFPVGYGGELAIPSRDITLNGNNHTIDFKNRCYYFHDAAKNINFNNMTIYGANWYGPIAANISDITYENINYIGSQLTASWGATVHIKGNVKVDSVISYTSPEGVKINTYGGGGQQNLQIRNLIFEEGSNYIGTSEGSGSPIQIAWTVDTTPGSFIVKDGATVKLQGGVPGGGEDTYTNLALNGNLQMLGKSKLDIVSQEGSGRLGIDAYLNSKIEIGSEAEIKITRNGVIGGGWSYGMYLWGNNSIVNNGKLEITELNSKSNNSLIQFCNNNNNLILKDGSTTKITKSGVASNSIIKFDGTGNLNLDNSAMLDIDARQVSGNVSPIYIGNGYLSTKSISGIEAWLGNSETPSLQWGPFNSTSINYNGVNARVTSVTGDNEGENINFKDTFKSNGYTRLVLNSVVKVDKSQLEDLLNNNQDTTGMTPESAKKYEDALAAGQKVFDNPKATQQEVNDAVKAIKDSLSALKPDKSGLQNAIDKAKDTLANGNLTPDSQQALQDAIGKAEGVLNNPDATVTDISGAIKDLEAATNGVVSSADKTELEKLLNEKVDTSGMTADSIKDYEDALALGQQIFDNPNATQQEVNDAINAIKGCKDALTPDKSGLQSAIDKATDALINGNLTPNSQQALQDAINNANKVLKNPNSTVTDINSAIKDLEAATNGAVTSADKAKLEELLNNKKDTAGMTPESAKKYEDALAAGQKVFNNPNATQQEVDDAVKAIEDSLSALKPDKSGLQSAIDKAKDTLANGNLTPNSQQALQDAINKAEGVLNNPNSTVTDINSAIKDLEANTNGAITSADKTKLEELLNNKASIDGKTPESIKKYEDALAAGQKVFVNPNASQKEVDDAIKAIESALQNMNNSIASIESNFKEAYWKDNKLVFGGTFDILNTNVDQNAEKVLLIKDNNGDIVKKIGTWNASWNGNTGYQCFINAQDFESLSNGTYKLYVSTTINGASYESAVKQPKSLLRYIVHNNINDLESQRFGTTVVKFSSNNDNDVIFTKEVSALTSAVNVKTMYFNESGLVVDGNFGFQGTSLNNPISVKLLIKDSTGNVIETIDTWKAGWGEKNTGFQGIISNDILSKLNKGEYTLFAKANFDGKDYETKLVTNSNFKVENIINDSFKVEVNANSDSVTFEKITAVRFDSSSEIKQSYWDGNSFVINGVVNIGDKVLDKNDIKKVVIKDSDGNQVGEVSTVSVDWFSNKGNFSGFQAIIPESLMEQLTIGTYSLEVQTTYKDVKYSNEIKQIPSLLRVFSIYKDVNDTEEKLFNNLLYKFATDSNNNVVLNVNQNILPAQSIANNVYWQNNLNSYFINGGVTIDGKEMQPDENEHMLVLKNSDGKIVSKSEVVQGWNEENPYQAQINSNMIDNLNPGTYKVYIRVTYDGKVYEAPIKLNSSLTLNTENHQTDRYTVNVGLNSSKDLTITVK